MYCYALRSSHGKTTRSLGTAALTKPIPIYEESKSRRHLVTSSKRHKHRVIGVTNIGHNGDLGQLMGPDLVKLGCVDQVSRYQLLREHSENAHNPTTMKPLQCNANPPRSEVCSTAFSKLIVTATHHFPRSPSRSFHPLPPDNNQIPSPRPNWTPSGLHVLQTSLMVYFFRKSLRCLRPSTQVSPAPQRRRKIRQP